MTAALRRSSFRLYIQLYFPSRYRDPILRMGVDFFSFAEGGNLASGTVIRPVILIREEGRGDANNETQITKFSIACDR